MTSDSQRLKRAKATRQTVEHLVLRSPPPPCGSVTRKVRYRVKQVFRQEHLLGRTEQLVVGLRSRFIILYCRLATRDLAVLAARPWP
jgi:hypothetical protein